jgi:hypothetical protein
VAHIADPVRPEHGLAAGDGQGVEGSDGALRVLLEVVEIRGVVAVVDAVENRQVELHQLLEVVKDPAQRRRVVAAGQRFHRAIRQEVDVELRTVSLDRLRQRDSQRSWRRGRLGAVEVSAQEVAEDRDVVPRAVFEAVADDDGLKVRVADGAEHRILERADLHDFVDEGVVGPPQTLQIVAGALPRRWIDRGDHQRLEVGLVSVAWLHVRRQQLGCARRLLLERVPGARIVPVRAAEHRRRDVLNQVHRKAGVPLGERLFDRRHQP